MKKIIFAYIGLIFVVILLAIFRNNIVGIFRVNQSSSSVTINNNVFKVSIADEASEREIGLSNRDTLAQDEGMLFVFDTKDYFPFWMKDTRIPLDIIFIDDDLIVYIFENVVPPSPSQLKSELPLYTPDKKANYVLEINGGMVRRYNIKVGDKVEFKNIRQ